MKLDWLKLRDIRTVVGVDGADFQRERKLQHIAEWSDGERPSDQA